MMSCCKKTRLGWLSQKEPLINDIYMNMKKNIFTTVSLLLLTTITVIAQVRLQSDQIDQVLKAMTLEEKAMLVVGGNLRTEN